MTLADLSRPPVTWAILLWPQPSACDPSCPLVALAKLIWPQPNLNDLNRLDMTFSDLCRPPVTLADLMSHMTSFELKWPYSTHMALADLRPPVTLSILMGLQQPFCIWSQLNSYDLSWLIWPRPTSWNFIHPHGTSVAHLWPRLSSCDLSQSLVTPAELIWPY